MSINSRIPDYDLPDKVEVTTPTQPQAIADPLRITILDLLLKRAALIDGWRLISLSNGVPNSRQSPPTVDGRLPVATTGSRPSADYQVSPPKQSLDKSLVG
jgi:hypothetical protein